MKNEIKIKDTAQLAITNAQLNKGWEMKKLGEVCELITKIQHQLV